MMSGDNKLDLKELCSFMLSFWKYIDDAVDKAFRVMPASRQTGPSRRSHRPHLGYNGLPSEHWAATYPGYTGLPNKRHS